jgi:phospholipid-binding lipoprotein MlaA
MSILLLLLASGCSRASRNFADEPACASSCPHANSCEVCAPNAGESLDSPQADADDVSNECAAHHGSSADDDEFDDELCSELDDITAPAIDCAKADPWEKANVFLYGVHRGVDLLFIRPLALTYTKILPSPVQRALSNFLRNLTAPLRVMCHLLQGHGKAAGKTAGAFVTNTLFGVGGLINVAPKMNVHDVSTNFTETLKTWGATPGPYLVVPGLGPTTVRGAVGFLLDSFIDPVFLLTLNKKLPGNEKHQLLYTETGMQLTSMLIARAKIDPIYESIEKNAGNRYSKLRMLVLQQPINK